MGLWTILHQSAASDPAQFQSLVSPSCSVWIFTNPEFHWITPRVVAIHSLRAESSQQNTAEQDQTPSRRGKTIGAIIRNAGI